MTWQRRTKRSGRREAYTRFLAPPPHLVLQALELVGQCGHVAAQRRAVAGHFTHLTLIGADGLAAVLDLGGGGKGARGMRWWLSPKQIGTSCLYQEPPLPGARYSYIPIPPVEAPPLPAATYLL